MDPESNGEQGDQPQEPQRVDPRSLSVLQRVSILVKALDGAKRTNEALAACANGDEMVEVLLNASSKLGLGLSRAELVRTPPIRDWIWWKNKEAIVTIGDAKPRYQQDGDKGRPDGETPRKKFLGLF
ncbi:hypothetical protein [Vulcanococcus sp.]|jgi:hypothetical protein|uniref:hypothetical protein n=1 Tax=Vulcanococcus sp. TaxID=2856995 RepID=UPI003231B991